MKLNSKIAKNSAVTVGAGVAGFIAGNKAVEMLETKLPASVAKHTGLILAATGIMLPALVDIKNDAAVSALHGMAGCALIKAGNAYTKDAEGNPEVTGAKGAIAKFLPQLSGLGSLPIVEHTYFEPARSLMEAGSTYEPVVRQLPAPQGNQFAAFAV